MRVYEVECDPVLMWYTKSAFHNFLRKKTPRPGRLKLMFLYHLFHFPYIDRAAQEDIGAGPFFLGGVDPVDTHAY